MGCKVSIWTFTKGINCSIINQTRSSIRATRGLCIIKFKFWYFLDFVKIINSYIYYSTKTIECVTKKYMARVWWVCFLNSCFSELLLKLAYVFKLHSERLTIHNVFPSRYSNNNFHAFSEENDKVSLLRSPFVLLTFICSLSMLLTE